MHVTPERTAESGEPERRGPQGVRVSYLSARAPDEAARVHTAPRRDLVLARRGHSWPGNCATNNRWRSGRSLEAFARIRNRPDARETSAQHTRAARSPPGMACPTTGVPRESRHSAQHALQAAVCVRVLPSATIAPDH